MKLKAPQGVGDPCVAGVTVEPRDGIYEVEAETAAVLIECFGFRDVGAERARPGPQTVPPPGSYPGPQLGPRRPRNGDRARNGDRPRDQSRNQEFPRKS